MIRGSNRLKRTATLALAATLVAASCGGSDDAAETDDPTATAEVESSEGAGATDGDPAESTEGGGGSYTIGLPSFFVSNLAPGNSGASNIDYAVWTPLTQVAAETGELENMVAESLESEDSIEWTITIGDGWTFHDGSAITAQSFVDGWNAVADPENTFENNASMSIIEGYEAMNPVDGAEATADTLSGLEVVDDLTFSVVLNEPNALFPFLLSSVVFAPLPEGVEDFAAFATNPIGNGPFMVQEGGFSEGDQDVVLNRFDDYNGDKALAESVNLRIYVDPSSIYTDFQAGAVDVMLADGADLADATENFPDQIAEVPFPAMIYLAFPIDDERFADPEVRQAFSRAIDRESIVTALTGGFATPSTALAPETMVGGGGEFCEACEYDPEAAAAQLEAAGGFEGPLTLYTFQDASNEAIIEAISNQMRTDLGIEDITFEAQEIGQLYDGLFAKTIDGPTLLYAGAVFPHLYSLAESTLLPDGGLNVTGFDNAEFNEMMAAAVSSSDADETVRLTQEAVDLALEEMPVTPVLAPVGGLVFADNLSGVIPEALGGVKLPAVQVN